MESPDHPKRLHKASRSSGGLTGTGIGDRGTGYIEVRSNNVIDQYGQDGTQVGTSEYQVSRGPTIFSSEEQWVLTVDDGPPEVMIVSESGSEMSLSENVYDGFSRSYARSR